MPRYFLTGEALAKHIDTVTTGPEGAYTPRDFVEPLIEYCTDNSYNGHIGMVYGLRSTGKTTGMLQAAAELTKRGHKVAYACFKPGQADLYEVDEEIISMADNHAFTHFFIDGAASLGRFVNAVTNWSDRIVPMCKVKIIIADDDNFALHFSKGPLLHRHRLFPAHIMSLPEYKRITGKGYEDYKRAAHTFSTEPIPEYIRTAIAGNLLRTFRHCAECERYRNWVLSSLDEIDEEFIYTAITAMLRRVAQTHLTKHFARLTGRELCVTAGDVLDERRAKALDLLAGESHAYPMHVTVKKPEWALECLMAALEYMGCLTETRSATYYFTHNALMHHTLLQTADACVPPEGMPPEEYEAALNQAVEGCLAENVAYVHLSRLTEAANICHKRLFSSLMGSYLLYDKIYTADWNDVFILDSDDKTVYLLGFSGRREITKDDTFVKPASLRVGKNAAEERYITAILYQGEDRVIRKRWGKLYLLNIEGLLMHSGEPREYFAEATGACR